MTAYSSKAAPYWVFVIFCVAACSDESERPSRVEAAKPEASSDGGVVTGKAPRATGGFPSVVILTPETTTRFPPPEEPAVMDQAGAAFHPEVLLVREGQRVEFRNSETELHNVHVVNMETGSTVFNVATPVFGSYGHRFERSGVYDVSCDIHPAMAAFIVVTSTPYATVADKDGHFTLHGVPAGTYRVNVWNLEPSRQLERTVEIGESATELVLDTG